MQWLIQSDVHGVSGCPWGLWVFMGHWVAMGSPCVHEVSGCSWVTGCSWFTGCSLRHWVSMVNKIVCCRVSIDRNASV